ncbi:MAG: hypothetical protein HY928_02530 [Elusimicrobia bacterium]|nr:hypothetical protein [Elusimicrobiota bacterium]
MPGFPGFPDERERLRLKELPMAASAEVRLGAFLAVPLLLFWAWALWSKGRTVLSLAAAAGAVSFVAAALRSKEGACPRCGDAIRAVAGHARCTGCPGYGYFRPADGLLRPVPPGTLDAGLGFLLTPGDLGAGPWRLPWDGGCCVCAARTDAVREARFAVQTSGIEGVAGRVESTLVPVPVCPEHPSGVRTAAGGGVAFQSYDYWLEFLRLNGRPS